MKHYHLFIIIQTKTLVTNNNTEFLTQHYRMTPQNLLLCSSEEWKSHGFETTCGWINDKRAIPSSLRQSLSVKHNSALKRYIPCVTED